MKRTLLLFTLFTLVFGFALPGLRAQSCLANWIYKRQFLIDYTNGDSLQTDYQIPLIIDTEDLVNQGKLDSTGKDLRFTSNDCCTPLCFWVESGMNTNSTTIWVKVPLLVPGTMTSVQMFYGNPAATDIQDPFCTFEFYDTFDSTALSTSRWNITNVNTSVASGKLNLLQTAFDGGISTKKTFANNGNNTHTVYQRIRGNNTSGQYFANYGWGVDPNPWDTRTGVFFYHIITNFGNQKVGATTCQGTGLGTKDNNWHKIGVNMGTWFSVDTDTIVWCSAGPHLVYRAAVSTWSSGCDTDIDYVFVVKDVFQNPPVWTMGVESGLNTFSLNASDTAICGGGTGNLWISPGFNSILWSTNETSDTIQVANPGWYTVTASDSGGCISTDSIFLGQYPSPSVSLSNLQFCDGNSGILDAGSGWASYQWSDNSTGQTLSVSSGGSYWVQVTNSFGCQGGDTAQVSVWPLPMPVVTHSAETLSTGSYATYQWNLNGNPIAGANSQSYVAPENGNYSVTVTDSNGCEGTSGVLLSGNLGLESGEFEVYPNPSSGWVNISGSSSEGNDLLIYIMDLKGREVFHQAFAINHGKFKVDADLSGLAKGIYLLQIRSGDQSTGRQIILK
ncbi:MAG: DUF2341 domain-containing protein [Bacteroidia bacterium]|nr:DUF2341 domain-containing protein [Bacteroidia bacterium]